MYLDPGIMFAQLLGGVSRAMILFLLSSGLSLTFGVMNILNFAHATLWLLGGYISFSIFTFIEQRDSNPSHVGPYFILFLEPFSLVRFPFFSNL